MHIMEGFLPPSHCIAWGAVSAPFLVHGAVKLRRVMREHPQARLTLAASGAFTFVLSFPIRRVVRPGRRAGSWC